MARTTTIRIAETTVLRPRRRAANGVRVENLVAIDSPMPEREQLGSGCSPNHGLIYTSPASALAEKIATVPDPSLEPGRLRFGRVNERGEDLERVEDVGFPDHERRVGVDAHQLQRIDPGPEQRAGEEREDPRRVDDRLRAPDGDGREPLVDSEGRPLY